MARYFRHLEGLQNTSQMGNTIYHSNVSGIQHVFCTNEQIATQFYILEFLIRISACSDMQCSEHEVCHSLAAVGVPQGVSLDQLEPERLILKGTVRVTWSPPTDLCGLTNPQYTIQYGTSTSTATTHPSTPSSSPLVITDLAVGQKYFVTV